MADTGKTMTAAAQRYLELYRYLREHLELTTDEEEEILEECDLLYRQMKAGEMVEIEKIIDGE